MKIRKRVLFCCLFLFARLLLYAQDSGAAFSRFITVGCGISYAATNSWNENKLHPGIHTMLGFHLERFFYLETASNYYFVHSSDPGFKNIHAWNVELNGHLILRVTKRAFFQVLAGGTYLEWKGMHSENGLNGIYKEGDVLYAKFFETNIGLGFTRQIGKRSFIDLSETMRISSQNNKYDLSGISLQLGYRYVLQFAKKETTGAETNARTPKTQHGIARGKYKWMKRR